MVKRYDSWGQFVSACKLKIPSANLTEWSIMGGFGKTEKQAMRLLESGNETAVNRAQTLLDKLESVEEGVPTRQWSASPYGAYPCVPDYLAGMPDCMRMLAPTGDIAPISIYVSGACSASLVVDDLERRGIAILALVLKLQQIRPIELYVLHEADGLTDGSYYQIIPVDSKPLSLAHACYALSDPSFHRRLTFQMARIEDGFTGAWPSGYKSAGYDKVVRIRLELSSDDLFVNGATSYDPLILDPIAWVNDQIKRYSALQD